MPSFLFTPSPNRDAVRFLKDKAPVAREVFDGLLPELRGLAFTITGVESMAIVKKAKERLANLPAGESWDAIKKDVAADLVPWLGDGAAKRAELLLRVHGYAAYSAAQYQVMDRQRDVFPFWQYQAAGDEKVRTSHQALDGLVFPADSAFWQTHFPPWEFGCRCQVVPLSEDDVAEIRQADAKRVPQARRVMEGDRLKLAETQGTLVTTRGGDQGIPAQLDVRSPREKSGGSGFYHNPGDLSVDLEQLRASYSRTPEGAAAFATFEQWARNTKLAPGRPTVWTWLSPRPRATPGTPAAPAPAAGDIPSDPAFFGRLKEVKRLGGSTGAMLVEDPQTGRRYVLKAGASPEHLLEEDRADAAYRALGQSVPPSVIGQRDGRPVKVAEFIEGRSLQAFLANASPAERAAVMARLESGFAADALLGNWDVVGMSQDNILVSADGTPWRIDNGGSLRFRAQGARKTAAEWNDYPQELWTLRDATKNPSTAKIFGDLDFYRIAAQVDKMQEADLLAAVGDELAPTVRARLGHLRDLATKAREFERADFSATHADGVARHMLGLRQAGVFERLAPSLAQTQPGSPTLYDSAGREFDHLRTAKKGTPSDPSQGFYDAIVPAAKTINGHHAKGDTAYNQPKLQAALAQKPQLESLLQTGTSEQKAMADHYLKTLVAIEAAQGKASATVPVVSKFDLPLGDQASVISRAADYLKAQGGDWQIISDWANAQAHSSRSALSMAVKQWYLERLPTAGPGDFHEPPSAKQLAAMRKKYGAEKVDTAFETLHALTQEVLARVEAPGNDTGRRLVRLLRTETTAAAVEGTLRPGQVGDYKRGVNESFSTITNFAGGSGAVTVSAMPHARVTSLYWFERHPGQSGGFLLGDGENEFTAIGWKIPVKYLGRNQRTAPTPGKRREEWEL